MQIRVKKLPNFGELPLPKHQTNGSCGIDLYAAIQDSIVLRPMESALLPTGLAFELPLGNEAQIRPRSSLSKKSILIYFGTCDEDYRGEYFVALQNLSKTDFKIERGDRLAQMVIAQYAHIELEEVAELRATSRGDKGFGSTGR